MYGWKWCDEGPEADDPSGWASGLRSSGEWFTHSWWRASTAKFLRSVREGGRSQWTTAVPGYSWKGPTHYWITEEDKDYA